MLRLPVFFALLHFSSGPLWPAFCFGTDEICRPFWPLPSRRTRCCATGRWPGCRRGDPGVRDPSPLVSNTPLRNVLARAARLAWYRTGEEGAWRPATEQQRPPSPPRSCSCCGGRRFESASLLVVVGGCCCTGGHLGGVSLLPPPGSIPSRCTGLSRSDAPPGRSPFCGQHPHPSGAWFVGRSAPSFADAAPRVVACSRVLLRLPSALRDPPRSRGCRRLRRSPFGRRREGCVCAGACVIRAAVALLPSARDLDCRACVCTAPSHGLPMDAAQR